MYIHQTLSMWCLVHNGKCYGKTSIQIEQRYQKEHHLLMVDLQKTRQCLFLERCEYLHTAHITHDSQKH
jgi:hypothetical protein